MISRPALSGFVAGIAIGAVAAGGGLWIAGPGLLVPAPLTGSGLDAPRTLSPQQEEEEEKMEAAIARARVRAQEEAELEAAMVQARVRATTQSCDAAFAYLQKSIEAYVARPAQ